MKTPDCERKPNLLHGASSNDPAVLVKLAFPGFLLKDFSAYRT
jgi:hypothetical protein